MLRLFSKALFDKRDHDLIRLVDEIRRHGEEFKFSRQRYYTIFHPHGIKEMVEPRGLRIAYAVAHLLTSLEVGEMEDRINALRILRAEAIESAVGPLPNNTARVLLSLMKEIVRTSGGTRQQLMLAHDFRTAASGKPRIIRRLLKRYHLLEMPEEWNQITFDDHVHDANSKGRKTPTHLVMDAWIKGIRRLRVIHYNFIEPRFAAELFSAAKLMDLDVRIGIEFSAHYRNKYIQLIWVPHGFSDTKDFLDFLSGPGVSAFMEEGRAVSAHQQQHVLALLHRFNSTHLAHFVQAHDLVIPPMDEAAFLKFVGMGQKSITHLSEFLQNTILDALQARLQELAGVYDGAAPESRKEIDRWVATMNRLDIESIAQGYLTRENNPDIDFPDSPHDSPPALLRLTAPEVLSRLTALHSGYRITLNLTNLTADEVLKLLYDCRGDITRLELFNLKDHAEGKTEHIFAINLLQQAINNSSLISLKQTVRDIIHTVEDTPYPDKAEKADRVAKLHAILHDLSGLKAYYQENPIKARIGSDSTGRSYKMHGMGLAVEETLPLQAQRELRHRKNERVREVLPLRILVYPTHRYIPHKTEKPLHPLLFRLALSVPFLNWIGFTRLDLWDVASASIRMAVPGNIVTLGGIRQHPPLTFALRVKSPAAEGKVAPGFYLRYLNTRLKNSGKVLLGFIPAFATFFLTKDWWVLAYLGAFIWFSITGIRNIIQMVLGGGGLHRSPMLRWNDYVSWERLTDSLLFTGFSVPLLDYLVKTLIMDRGLGITTAHYPVLLYTCMALANGIYLFSHNTFRGLPKGAAYTNLFRSLLSIPIAVGINVALVTLLPWAGVAAPNAVLQKWAAIISKTASDIVAGIIEGIADRYANIRLRMRDFRQKFDRILALYSQLELRYPEVGTGKILGPETGLTAPDADASELERMIMLHSLDLLYFWMYQPRARGGFKQFIDSLPEVERHIMVRSQFTLQRDREISQLLINGMFGNNFQNTLSFYLAKYPEYLSAIKGLGR